MPLCIYALQCSHHCLCAPYLLVVASGYMIMNEGERFRFQTWEIHGNTAYESPAPPRMFNYSCAPARPFRRSAAYVANRVSEKQRMLGYWQYRWLPAWNETSAWRGRIITLRAFVSPPYNGSSAEYKQLNRCAFRLQPNNTGKYQCMFCTSAVYNLYGPHVLARFPPQVNNLVDGYIRDGCSFDV